jgi:lysophospholipase L1-like esterase
VTDSALPDGAAGFEYSNLSGRTASRFLRLARRLLPGVDAVENEIAPYAAQWHEHNVAALGRTEPLWIALGDSLSQGVGASSIAQGWVLQTQRALSAVGIEYRVINLSVSGATVPDVIQKQIPALRGLAAAPALVTIFIGSNDVIHRSLRLALAEHYRDLIAALPHGTLVAVTPRARGALGEVNRIVSTAASAGVIVPVLIDTGSDHRARDHFHPNDQGYALIAAKFTEAVVRRDSPPRS